jgi:hypothetical protein
MNFFFQLAEKPVPKNAGGEPFTYLPTAPVPLYGEKAPSLEKILLSTSERKRRRDAIQLALAKRTRTTRVTGTKKRAPIILVSDSEDDSVRLYT